MRLKEVLSLLAKEVKTDLTVKPLKKQQLRNNEYYDMQENYDNLYYRTKNGFNHFDLMKYVLDENNILLAYRNIKSNKGSITFGVDKITVNDFKEMTKRELIDMVQGRLSDYNPKPVRRVEIPKPNGKMRPLGIPCFEDRITQQCIKQVLEPICEAKFHNHSYGFRPNRSCEHAIARSMSLINLSKLHYVVDVDIKGFFDNINHAKLLKQVWALGIKDKSLLSIINAMLKCEIQGLGKQNKGTPQGGIISPLLANICLNELDWWISDQWERFETRHNYANKHKYRAIKSSRLKEMFIVRYADDFKIFCRDIKSAQKIFIAIKQWLKERLGLEISNEKSRITNIRKGKTEFLGFKLYVKMKGKDKKGNPKYVCQSNMSDKAKKQVEIKLKQQIKIMQHCNDSNMSKEVAKFNSMVMGVQNYYQIVTNVSSDFSKINYLVSRTLNNRLKVRYDKVTSINYSYKIRYGKYKSGVNSIRGRTLFLIYGVTTRNPMNLTQTTCNYTKDGRKVIHKELVGYDYLL